MDNNDSLWYWTDRILSLTRDVRLRDLAMQLGQKTAWQEEPFLFSTSDLNDIRRLDRSGNSRRLYFQATEHFLRTRVEPLQAVFSSWMEGAKAQVDGEEIPFNQVITWCQDRADNQARQLLTQEIRTLCRFLAPLSRATWQALLVLVREELGFADYIAYCEQKRGISLRHAEQQAASFLAAGRSGYSSRISSLLTLVTDLPLSAASRFDAIYLLGLRYLDHHFPEGLNTEKILSFFRKWGFELIDGSNLTIHHVGQSGRQSYCMPVTIPDNIHVILGPLKGWLDLEALFHELGHALTFLYTDTDLSPLQADFFPSGALSESFAFLFQKMCMSREFLQEILGLSDKAAEEVTLVHEIKWVTLARRYASKLVIETTNFRQGHLRRGEEHYAQTMKRETGFSYDPETYLFDLMPDFYTLDYFQAFLGAAIIEQSLQRTTSGNWYQCPAACRILKEWWKTGNRQDLRGFLARTLHTPLTDKPFYRQNQPAGSASHRHA